MSEVDERTIAALRGEVARLQEEVKRLKRQLGAAHARGKQNKSGRSN